MNKWIFFSVFSLTACVSNPKPYYPGPSTDSTANVKIHPSGAGKTWVAVCHNRQWHYLNQQPLSSNVWNYDVSTFTSTIPELVTSLPANEPLLVRYSAWTSAGTRKINCSTTGIFHLQENQQYVLKGGFKRINNIHGCSIRMEQAGEAIPALVSKFDCESFGEGSELYQAAKERLE